MTDNCKDMIPIDWLLECCEDDEEVYAFVQDIIDIWRTKDEH